MGIQIKGTYSVGEYVTFIPKDTYIDVEIKNKRVDVLEPMQEIAQITYGRVTETEADGSQVTPMHFADLHRQSGYSLLNSTIHLKDMAKKTDHAGALTDKYAMYGMVEYYRQMTKHQKQPIFGLEAWVKSARDKKRYPVVLLAYNNTGIQSLIKLSSEHYLNDEETPFVTEDNLKTYQDGLLLLTGGPDSEIDQALRQDDFDKAVDVLTTWIDIYGQSNVYIEIQRHFHTWEDALHQDLKDLSDAFELPLVATNGSLYLNDGDSNELEVLHCLRDGTTVDDQNRKMLEGEHYHIHTEEEMVALFHDMPEALEETVKIAKRCETTLMLDNVYMPHFDIPEGFLNEEDYFVHLCWEGFDKRFQGTAHHKDPVYKERLQFEIDTILNMGFPGYFLIVWDFVAYAKNNDILVGPGRGSACGSLVSYVLAITDIEPIKYDLLFERFLNPDRVSMPDIDIDFDDERREEVIDYVKEKYGHEAVSRIITFGTLSARSVVRDVARVKGFPYRVGDEIAKSIPDTPGITLTKALEESQTFHNLYEHKEDVRDIVDTALKIEGLPRNTSIHACGVIISPTDVTDYIPQIQILDDNGVLEGVTQVTMSECEEMGLLKMDFLGLRTMGVVGRTLEMINAVREQKGEPLLTYADIPINDVNVYHMISKGQTEGVFQLESPGMTGFMKELFQDTGYYILESEERKEQVGYDLFERIVAGISLYRPGPIDEIPNYINNMLKPKLIDYAVPQLESILKASYGIIVYQEQVMLMVRELAGFSKGQADTIRKAMSKKKVAILDEYEQYFIYGNPEMNIVGCVKNNIKESVAKDIWDKMKKFGLYAFNKSHAAGYANISVKTAWLVYYYPKEYMTATLNSFITKADKIRFHLGVCRKKGLTILPPDMNASVKRFKVEADGIRFGLMGIRNMGKLSESVMLERQARGPFKGLQDFVERMGVHEKINKRALEALTYAGAFDGFGGTRQAKLTIIPDLLISASLEKKQEASGQLDMFDISDDFQDIKDIQIPDVEEMPKRYRLKQEKNYAGFYLSEHPLDDFETMLKREDIYDIAHLLPEEGEVGENDYTYDGEKVKIAGIITEHKTIYTKKEKKPMYILKVEDKTGEMKGVMFEDVIEMNQGKVEEGRIVILEGKISVDSFGTQIIVSHVYDIDAITSEKEVQKVWIQTRTDEQIKWVEAVAKRHEGQTPLYLYHQGQAYKLPVGIDFSLSVYAQLQDMFGEKCKLVYS